jgi:hypothetical protein
MLMDATRVRVEPNPTRILADFRAEGQRHVIAARLRGALRSAFPDGPPALAEGQERAADMPAHKNASDDIANLVVINDTDILDDRFWVRVENFFGQPMATPFAGNGSFIVNIAEQLGGSDALIGLRSRGESLRPFEVVDAIRRSADAQYRQTERGLQERLEATERRLRELRQGSTATAGERNQSLITPEQRAEIDAARADSTRPADSPTRRSRWPRASAPSAPWRPCSRPSSRSGRSLCAPRRRRGRSSRSRSRSCKAGSTSRETHAWPTWRPVSRRIACG